MSNHLWAIKADDDTLNLTPATEEYCFYLQKRIKKEKEREKEKEYKHWKNWQKENDRKRGQDHKLKLPAQELNQWEKTKHQ